MACLSQTCEQLEVLLGPQKCEGLFTCLKFLGIEIDSVSMELWLPADKLQRVKKSVQEWLEKDSGRKKDINSFVGLLQHASTVVKPGRHFV